MHYTEYLTYEYMTEIYATQMFSEKSSSPQIVWSFIW